MVGVFYVLFKKNSVGFFGGDQHFELIQNSAETDDDLEPLRLSKRHSMSPQTVLCRTTPTWMIIIYLPKT